MQARRVLREIQTERHVNFPVFKALMSLTRPPLQ
jgi:hypothetical protein